VGTPPSQTSSEAVDAILATLRANGGRATTARRQLLQALFDSGGHRTAEDLATEVQASSPDIHISTVYRNLDEFERLGIVFHTHLGHGPAIYHLSSAPHGHLVCANCGTAIEAAQELFSELSENAERRFGFLIDPRHFAMLGCCHSCAG